MASVRVDRSTRANEKEREREGEEKGRAIIRVSLIVATEYNFCRMAGN